MGCGTSKAVEPLTVGRRSSAKHPDVRRFSDPEESLQTSHSSAAVDRCKSTASVVSVSDCVLGPRGDSLLSMTVLTDYSPRSDEELMADKEPVIEEPFGSPQKIELNNKTMLPVNLTVWYTDGWKPISHSKMLPTRSHRSVDLSVQRHVAERGFQSKEIVNCGGTRSQSIVEVPHGYRIVACEILQGWQRALVLCFNDGEPLRFDIAPISCGPGMSETDMEVRALFEAVKDDVSTTGVCCVCSGSKSVQPSISTLRVPVYKDVEDVPQSAFVVRIKSGSVSQYCFSIRHNGSEVGFLPSDQIELDADQIVQKYTEGTECP
eukprot:ANDGO_05188.mRNA.1 hypothetical protein